MTAAPELRAALVQLRARVDAHFDAAVARTPEAYACREGCDRCCHQRFSVFEVEAAPMREALTALGRRDPALRARVRAQAGDPGHRDRCALLVDGRCAVYSARPLICRSHGLPVAVDEEDGGLRLDCCPLNFRGEGDDAVSPDGARRRFEPQPPRESVLRLAAVNQPLAVLAELRWAERAATRTASPAA
ncbi:MAG: YkgJ family cysteine cluster protein, partial [Myxococcales bacterium]|nr:YkgJ family cysteine cluster protein [Myxococcales bacterium]